MDTEWLTTGEVARLIGLSTHTVRRLADAGTWASAYTPRRGGQWRIPRHEVAAWLESMRPRKRARQPVETPPPAPDSTPAAPSEG